MRFLAFLIISSFLFIAPMQGDSREVSGKQLTAVIENKTPGDALTNVSLIACHAEAIIVQSKSPIAQFRFSSYTNFINNVPILPWIKFLPRAKDVVQPYLYCKPIGLKLVFPEHYFW